jgi:outer membrane protein OmpA-like peptidoglycan-associated protein
VKRLTRVLCLLLLATCATAVLAADDLDYQRLSTSLNQLAADPALGGYAQAEQALARNAVQLLPQTRGKDHAHALYIAERRVDTARAAAQLEQAQAKLVQLDREHDSILIEASRRDAEASRQELERQRLQNQLAAEEAARLQQQGEAYSLAAEQARAEAEQSRQLAESQSHAAAMARREAKLAEAAASAMRARMDSLTARRGAQGMQMTLEDVAFASGQASLRPDARAHLGKLLQFVQAKPDKRIHIVGHTDSSGSAAANQALSLQRAQSVRAALVAAGVEASRIEVAGAGAADPVASNTTAAGRARNRRVVVILEDR